MNRMLRRDFLRGAAAFGLGGWRIFAAPPGWRPEGKPELVFGVVSDTHLRTANNGKYSTRYWSDKWFVAALRAFHAANVDAVLHCGDMAHCGQVEEMEFHAAAWRKVFPRDLAPDGHKVERLFVTGNHDLEALNYGIGELVRKIHPDPEEMKKHVLATDIAAHWERIWGEPYADVWHRTVKGYHFFGRHYVPGKGIAIEAQTVELVKKIMGRGTRCGKPFFLFSHIRPRRAMNRAMREYPDAVAFFGHWHQSAANWNRIYMWSTGPTIQCPSCAPQGVNALAMKADAFGPKVPIADSPEMCGSRQCYVVRVYGDALVIARHEVGKGGKLGPDWVMPLGKYDPHPFSQDELRKTIGEPQFRKDGELKVENEEKAQKLSIPLADGNPDSRVFAYDVEVVGEDPDKKLCKSVYAAGCSMGIGHEPNGGVTTLEIPKSELPHGKTLSIVIQPITSLATRGRALTAKFVTSEPVKGT